MWIAQFINKAERSFSIPWSHLPLMSARCTITLESIFAGFFNKLSHVMRKPTFCICENKDADQLRGNREADQHLCFRYIDSTIPLLYKSEIWSLQPFSVAVQPGLCRTWLETRMLVFSWHSALLIVWLPHEKDSVTASKKSMLQVFIGVSQMWKV